MKIMAFEKTTQMQVGLSTFMPRCRDGIERQKQEFIYTIEGQSMEDVKAICDALNNHHWTTEKFEPYMPLDDGFSILATDPFGNQYIIQIVIEEEEEWGE